MTEAKLNLNVIAVALMTAALAAGIGVQLSTALLPPLA